MRARTTAAESRISDIEDKLPPLLRETQSTACLAKATYLRAADFENHLRRNKECIVELPEKVEGHDPNLWSNG